MSFWEWALSSSTVLSAWLCGAASLAALAGLLWSREWRTHVNLTALTAFGTALLTYSAFPEWWTVMSACWTERVQVVLSVGVALELSWRSFGVMAGTFLPRTGLAGLVCYAAGYCVRYFQVGAESCMRGLVAWDMAAFGVLTEIRLELQAHRVRVDRISNVATRALCVMWACAVAYRGSKEVLPRFAEFAGFVQVGVYCWAMLLVVRACMDSQKGA